MREQTHTLENTEGVSKMDNSEKLATYDTQDEEKQKHNMRWTPLYADKHKPRK